MTTPEREAEIRDRIELSNTEIFAAGSPAETYFYMARELLAALDETRRERDENARTMYPLHFGSGHYCDGMAEAWRERDAAHEAGERVFNTQKVNIEALQAENVQLRSSLENLKTGYTVLRERLMAIASLVNRFETEDAAGIINRIRLHADLDSGASLPARRADDAAPEEGRPAPQDPL